MLLKDRGINITEAIIEQETGKPASASVLAHMRSTHLIRTAEVGGVALLLILSRSITSMKEGRGAAMFWEPGGRIGHFVIVDGLDTQGHVKIRDPMHGTRYEMELDYFLNDVWT